MSTSVSRRIATSLAAAVAATGLLMAGTAPASADPGATSNQATTDNLTYSKSVVGGTAGATLYPGATVTYKNEIVLTGGAERYISKIRDIPPAGFVYQEGSAKITAGPKTVANFEVEPDGSVAARCKSACGTLGNGFFVRKSPSQPLIFEVTYKVPATAATGVFSSGVVFDVWSFIEPTQGQVDFGVNVEVLPAAVTTTTTQLAVPASAETGQPVSLTATVAPAAAGGTVQFKDGGANIGGPVTVQGGAATLTHTFTEVGNRNITAVFTAGAGFGNSTSAASVVAVTAPDPNKTATTTSLSAVGAVAKGDTRALTATVAPGGATGTVQFTVNGVSVGAPVAVTNGVAKTNYTFAEAGAHAVIANFVGTGNFANSSAAQTVTVAEPVGPGDSGSAGSMDVFGSLGSLFGSS